MGDPSGVGPEVICRAIEALSPSDRAGICVVGDRHFMERAGQLVGATFVFQSRAGRNAIPLVEVEFPQRESISDGAASAGGGHAAFACIVRALELAQSGTADVIVTAPLNKAALHLAGHRYDGHTGMLREMTGAPTVYMLLAAEVLRTIHVSTHVSLHDAVKQCTQERVLDTIRAGHEHLLTLGIENPRIAVAGLNPHAGENGLFGQEDQSQIVPAVARACAEGMRVDGPISGDTVFLRASRGEFDLVVAQYHDQGHIPTKLIAFDTAVNVTLGLPILRTSVDHGTAFDIAWKGEANHENMLAAIAYARRIST